MGLKQRDPILLLFICLASASGAGSQSSSSFQGILQQVTDEKLEELRIQTDLMTNHFNPALEKARDPSNTPKQTLQILYTAVQTSPIKDLIANNLIENLKHVLENSEVDPSLTPQLFLAWTQKIQTEIERAMRKSQYSYYFGSLLSEWLEIEERKQSQAGNITSEKAEGERNKAIEKFSQIMFNSPSPDEFNAENFKNYLEKEFFDAHESTDIDNTIKQIRKEASEFMEVKSCVVSNSDVQSCIHGLLSEDLLPEDKKAALKELAQNSDTLIEVASLLTNRLKNVDRWDWPNSTTTRPVDVRRDLGGEYKIFLNEDVLTALFLQYVGVQWASFFKHRLTTIYNSKMWTRVTYNYGSIEWERNRFHSNSLLTVLPDSMQSQENNNNDEYVKIESEQTYTMERPMSKMIAMNGHGKMMHKIAYSTTPAPYVPPPKPDIDFKQSLLHVLSTEIHLHHTIHPDKPLFVVQADLETFGPSINHDAVLLTMEQFGVSKQWLGFFKKFLQPSVRFKNGEDARKPARGVPTAHALSNLFGETLLFALELVVNSKCHGMRIYRIGDEIWFWNKDENDIIKAWQTINEFGTKVGLKVNEKRSGSVQVLPKSSTDSNLGSSIPGSPPLPQQNIHWGYLELYSNGIFKIDGNSTTKFLDEMNTLLGKAECALEWIQIFNKYIVFFVRNFGKGALVFGKQHMDQITSSLREIYGGVFGSLEKSAVVELKEKFKRLPNADLLDAWIYWPLEMGGLGLTDPFIEISALGKTYASINDEDYFQKLPLQDKIEWDELKVDYERNYGPIPTGNNTEQGRTVIKKAHYGKIQELPPPKFLSWEEYLATRETELSYWYGRYLRLLERPNPEAPTMPSTFWQLRSLIPDDEPDRNYFMWLYSYYETQLEQYFGTSTFINSELLPKSMIGKIQKTKLNY